MNRPVELWHVLEAADLANEAFGSWPRYCQMFGAVKKSIYTGHGKREVLDWGPPSAEVARCLRSVSLRRHRLDVLPDLPTKIHQDHIVDEIPAETREQCDELVRKLERQGIDLTDATATIELARIEDAAFDMLSRIRAALATAKLPALIRLVETFEESEEPVVVFSAHRKPIDTLGARPGWAAITGDVGHERRTEIVADFQAGKLKGLALTIAAGGVGLTLTHAHQALFCDLAWTPAANAQAEDRICVLEGQLIHTRAGMTPVEAVKVGDLVLNKEGNWTPVTAVSSRQHLGLVTDIGYTRYTTPLRLTHDHLVLVLRREEPSPQWVPAFSILPGDFLLMPRPLPGPRLTSLDVPEEDRPPNESTNQFGFKQRQGRRRQLPPSVTLDEDLLFTFGFYLAEGFASIRPNKGRFISFSAHSEERPILERIANRLTTLGGVRCSIYTASANGIEMRAFSADLARWFFGLFGHGARHKSIPPVLMDLPADQARHLLEGYLVGDGYDRRRQRSWVSVSLALSHQIALLALRCGYSPALNERKEPAGAWVGTFTVDGDPDNPGLVKADESFVYQPVRTVTTYNASRHPRPVVYDLEVPDGESFVVGMATVHNCRIGQDRGVIVTRLIADHLVDRKVTELLARKQELIEATVEASAVGGGR